jgi:hypothetical protein
MSIKPPIKCPPDYSILSFRLTECRKFGVVKGINTLADVDMTNMFVPIANYEERMLTLKAGQTKKIDVSSIGILGEMTETYTFDIVSANVGSGTEHTYSLYDESLGLIESINFTVDLVNTTFAAAFQAAIANSTTIKTTVSVAFANFDTPTGTVTITATARGVKYRHLLSVDNTGFGGYFPFPFLSPGDLSKAYQKYNDPRVKILFFYPDFYKSNPQTGCNCLDPSGELKSNVKWIEYAFIDDYNKINNPTSPIIVEPNGSLTDWKWLNTSLDHIDYHFKVGSIIQIKNSINPNARGMITSIDGFEFTVDSPIGDLTTVGQKLTHAYSPNAVQWNKMGDLYIQTTGQDISDTDYNFIQTLVLRNPHNYDLPINILIGS